VPAAGTTDEFFQETSGALAGTQPLPVGLGFRVPLLLISPWTRGGWVTSEVSDHTSVIQFLEKWTEALGAPAISPNISAWRRSVCGDLTGAFDFTTPVFGLPTLPATTVIGDPPGGAYHPPATTNAAPQQEPGTKPARPLPYQPNANLDGFAGSVARLSFSNSGPHVRKASHFAVYNNVTPDQTLVSYPSKYPGQYTVPPSHRTVSATIEIGTGPYDLTVVGPNRFLRRFTGDTNTAAQVTATYHQPGLTLELANGGAAAVTFTVTPNNYATGHPKTYRVPAHGRASHAVDLFHRWYDVTVTVSGDQSWSRRYVGHLENGGNSVTG
jgi:phospholipase C